MAQRQAVCITENGVTNDSRKSFYITVDGDCGRSKWISGHETAFGYSVIRSIITEFLTYGYKFVTPPPLDWKILDEKDYAVSIFMVKEED